MTEQELLIDCLGRLNRIAVNYMITGSMASNYWGIPRTTHDLDFVLQLPTDSIPALVREFEKDFHIDELAIRRAFSAPYQFNAIDTRSALKVDFWILQTHPFEREMFQRRLQVSLFDTLAWLSTAEDVILHKLYWNTITPSERQLHDAAGVVAVQGLELDISYLRHWADQLEVTETLNLLLSRDIRPKSS